MSSTTDDLTVIKDNLDQEPFLENGLPRLTLSQFEPSLSYDMQEPFTEVDTTENTVAFRSNIAADNKTFRL